MDATLNVSDREQSAKRLTTIIYALYAGGLLTGGLTALVAIIMNYVKKAEVAGTWLESHFQSQKKTFWYSFIGIFGGSVLASIAGMVGAAIAVWMGNFLGVTSYSLPVASGSFLPAFSSGRFTALWSVGWR